MYVQRIILCISTSLAGINALLWIASHFWMATYHVPTEPDHNITIISVSGTLEFTKQAHAPIPAEPYNLDILSRWHLRAQLKNAGVDTIDVPDPFHRPSSWAWGSFAIPNPKSNKVWRGTTLRFPYWPITLAFGAWPTIALIMKLAIRRKSFKASPDRTAAH